MGTKAMLESAAPGTLFPPYSQPTRIVDDIHRNFDGTESLEVFPDISKAFNKVWP